MMTKIPVFRLSRFPTVELKHQVLAAIFSDSGTQSVYSESRKTGIPEILERPAQNKRDQT
jgi:hypothetical protein